MTNAALIDFVPREREDHERYMLASDAALELDNIRLGREGITKGNVAKIISWLEENFSSGENFSYGQAIILRDVCLETGFLDQEAKTVSQLIASVGYIQIILRGIIDNPASARRSIPTIERMRDFCLKLANK